MISSAAADRIRRVAAELPAALTDWIYLECKLSGSGGRADLIVRVDRAGRDLILRSAPRQHPARACPERLPEAVRSVCRAWADPAGSLSREIHQLWLEFDVPVRPRTPRDGLEPGIFVGLGGSAGPDRAWRVACALCQLPAQAGLRRAAEQLRRCFAALPPHASIPYLGWFPSRSPSVVRLCLARLSGKELLRYLQAIRWHGRIEELERISREAGKLTAASTREPRLLHLDVSDALLPAAGLEYVLARVPQLRGRIEDRPLLELLVRNRLCTRRKLEALRAWPGASVESLPHQLWPSVAVRRINHLKLVVPESGRPVAKAYLSINTESKPSRRPTAVAV